GGTAATDYTQGRLKMQPSGHTRFYTTLTDATASPDLAHAAARMIEHLAASGDSGSAVSITRLYTTAIALMSASEDSEIARAYRRIETAFTLQIR
ncbi:hypothetical protein ACQKE8_24835, partial [Sphingobium limneticum]